MRIVLLLSSRIRNTAALVGLLALTSGVARAQEVLTNESIVQMITGKLSKDLILLKIKGSTPGYDLSADGLVYLASKKVNQDIMRAMMNVTDDANRASGQRSNEVLSNESVVRMVAGQVPKPIILAKLQNTRSTFDLSTTGLVRLNESKVPQDVIKVMMTPPPTPPALPEKASQAPPPAMSAPPASPPPAPADSKKAAAPAKKVDPKKVDPKAPPPKKPPTTR